MILIYILQPTRIFGHYTTHQISKEAICGNLTSLNFTVSPTFLSCHPFIWTNFLLNPIFMRAIGQVSLNKSLEFLLYISDCTGLFEKAVLYFSCGEKNHANYLFYEFLY